MHCERFVDKAPAQVWATLLDEGTYLCSIRTMYRILEEHGEVRERRNQRRHPNYTKPEAGWPKRPTRFGRGILRSFVAPSSGPTTTSTSSSTSSPATWLAGCWLTEKVRRSRKRLIAESCRKQDIEPDQLTLHADRGSSMRSKPVALLLANLGVTKTHSRPYVSNDNPYSESQFKTMKYCPQFPSRFGSAEDGRLFCGGFLRLLQLRAPALRNRLHDAGRRSLWSRRTAHHRSAPDPSSKLIGLIPNASFAERPQPPVLPPQAWINPPTEKTTLLNAAQATLAAASIPGVPPFSAPRNEISIDADVDRTGATSLPTLIEAH